MTLVRCLPHRCLPAARAGCFAILLLGFTLSTAAAEPCTEAIHFSSPVQYVVGPNPLFMSTTGDFNDDGVTDYAVTASDFMNGGANGKLAVVLGTGPRTFAAPVLYDAGLDPHDVKAGDLNQDGITDLVASAWVQGTIAVLIGQGSGGIGNGTFASPVFYPAGAGPFQIVLADFNLDGIVDVAVADNAEHSVSVLPGLGSGGVGNGTFGPRVAFATANIGVAIDTGDFNQDGKPDLVSTEYLSGTVVVLLGTGNPTIGPASFATAAHFQAGPEPFDIAIADVDENGHQDILVSNGTNGGTAILLGSGTGFFGAPSFLPSGNSACVVATDANLDGILDLLVGVTGGANAIKLYLGQGVGGVGNGTFGFSTSYTLPDPYQLAVGDFDGDGFQDVLASSYLSNLVSFLWGTCAAAPPDPRAPAITDVRDVPNDDGGKVFVTWTASSADAPGGSVIEYRVWRRIPPASALALAGPRRAALRTVESIGQGGVLTIEYWEALATLPAQRMPGYGYTAATTQDSMRSSNPYTAFFVTAATANLDVFFNSAVDSGYSVDNKAPHGPSHAVAEKAPQGIALSWEAGDEADLAGFRVYRGASADFEPSEANRIADVTELAYLDAGAEGDQYYKITAFDVHQNESEPAVVEPLSVLGVGDGAGLRDALRIAPNPSRTGALAVHYSLARAQAVRIEAVDLAGRTVAVERIERAAPGDHHFVLDGARRLQPGMYFVRMILGRRVLEAKAVVMQ